MTHDDRGHLALAIALTALAGYVDAVGFLRLGHLFISFMSGNSTQFAVALTHGMTRKSAAAGGIVGLYVTGVIAGRLLANATKAWRRPVILVADAALLGLAVVIRSSPPAIVPVALAMGLQNEALHSAGSVRTNLTYVTGTLVNTAERFADAFTIAEPEERWAWVPYLLMFVGLVAGAAIAAAVYGAIGMRALLVPAVLLVGLGAITAVLVATGHDGKWPRS